MYRDYEVIDYYKMKMPNVGGEELLLKDISKDRYKDFAQKISACWINIGSDCKSKNRDRIEILQPHSHSCNAGW
jgi:hypothetical protein